MPHGVIHSLGHLYGFSEALSRSQQQPSLASVENSERRSQGAALFKYSATDSSMKGQIHNKLDGIRPGLTNAGILEVSRRDHAALSGSC